MILGWAFLWITPISPRPSGVSLRADQVNDHVNEMADGLTGNPSQSSKGGDGAI